MFKERRDAKPTITYTAGEPSIYISPIALEKMYYYVKSCAKEIGWLGKVSKYEGNVFLVEDVFLFRQQVHSATCEITPQGISEFVCDLYTNDAEHATDIINGLKLWGHSHVNMTVSPSGQDDSQMKTFADSNEWFIRVIANKSGEMEFSLFDFKLGIQYKNVKWAEHRVLVQGLEESIKAEVKEKVTDIVYNAPKYTPAYYGHGYNFYDDEDFGAEKKTNVTYLNQSEEKKEEENEICWILDENGKYNKVLKYDKAGKLNTKVIENEFTAKEFMYIAECKDMNEVEILVCTVSTEPFSTEDCVQIFNYASNKYPV